MPDEAGPSESARSPLEVPVTGLEPVIARQIGGLSPDLGPIMRQPTGKLVEFV